MVGKRHRRFWPGAKGYPIRFSVNGSTIKRKVGGNLSTPQSVQGPAPNEVLLQYATGFMVSSALYTITQAGIADLLEVGPRPVKELAKATGSNEDALYRMLRALASIGIFSETSPQTFGLTSIAELLVRSKPGSMRDMVLWMGDSLHHKCFAEMPHALKNGQTVIEKATGFACFDYFEQDKATGEVFNAAMTTFSQMLVPVVLESYDFSLFGNGTLVDIAGGHGYLLTEILKKYPTLHGILFDLEHVVVGGKSRIESAGIAHRCKLASGDFFVDVPAGDAYIMKNIIHDWDDERSLKILQAIRKSASAKAKVILVETVLAPGNDPHFGKWLDLEMLLLPGGRERTEQEFANLFERAGFRQTRVIRTKSPVCVIEAEKIA
jgi:hypothetical protein